MTRILTRFFFGSILSCALLPLAHAELTTAWLFLRHDGQETIISVNPQEKATLLADGWVMDAEGSVHTAWLEGSGPLHRLARVKERGADRLLETDVQQVAAWVTQGFNDEGVVGYVSAADGPGHLAVKQYRKGEARLWLVSEAAAKQAEADGWQLAGVHFWLWPALPPPEPASPEPAPEPDAPQS